MIENEIGINSFRNEWQKASISILFTHGMLFNSYERFFKSYDLTTQQYNILRILYDQYPDPVSTSFLREKMMDKMSDASRLVNRLASKELVLVSPNTSDKRLVNILISERGINTIKEITGKAFLMDEMLQGLTEEEAMQLTDLLYKSRESIRKVNESRAAAAQDHS
ncbi:MarR family transcriptional regulator [Pontibacter sp. SGAir0037]|uniref:MarR family transcriptional regulator n=1 Tax=Pontibacter sp. SGAir0037 TaxID=2571030 RepID=UPI0010CCB673|nr:MarR family transcriptional regulator [Pontibacter sp. SGAir0037]QCR22019.1 MarR family transcriptional regulator [Pontibacter sp. SGAir0037]